MLTRNDIGTAIKGGKNLLLGKSPRPDRLTNMTVEKDDAEIILYYLNHPEEWEDDRPILRFEEDFARLQKVTTARAFMGGRVALSSIIHALGLVSGDKVLVPAYTCVVVPNAFWFAGIKVEFYDIELGSYGPCVDSLKSEIEANPDVKAVVIHHLFGLVARDYEKLVAVCRQNDLLIIEDCAHSIGLKKDGVAVGNLGDAAFFSTEHSKIISTFNGGVATTKDPVVAKKISAYQKNAPFPSADRMYSLLNSFLHGYYTTKAPMNWLTQSLIAKKYRPKLLVSTTKEEMAFVRPDFYGQRMPAPLAKVGSNQLSKVEDFNRQRFENSTRWDEWCETMGYEKPFVVSGSTPVFLRYPVLVSEEMKKDRSWAKKLHIELGMWFSSPIHPVPYKVENCPNAMEAVSRCVNFPTLSY